jgi:tetratricopeptide (TPR) repeat protein
LAKTLREDGDIDGAIAEYREVIRLQPDNPDAHYQLGASLYDKGEHVAVKVARVESWPTAEAELRTALRLKPDHAEARLVLGEVLYSEGSDGKADLLVTTMSACDPKGDTGKYLACTRMAVQSAENLPFPKLEQAIAEYRKTLGLNPNWGEAHYGLAQALWRNSYSQRDEALKEYGAACLLEPTNPKFCKDYKSHQAQWDPKRDR